MKADSIHCLKKVVEWYIEWKRMTTIDNEWQRVVQQVTTSDSKWQQVAIWRRPWKEPWRGPWRGAIELRAETRP